MNHLSHKHARLWRAGLFALVAVLSWLFLKK
jgi:hypothetical protein